MDKKIKQFQNFAKVLASAMMIGSFWLPYLLMCFGAKYIFNLEIPWDGFPTYFWVIYMVGMPIIFVLTYFRVLVFDMFITSKCFFWGLILINIPFVYLSTFISTPMFMVIVSWSYPILYLTCSRIQLKINKNKEEQP